MNICIVGAGWYGCHLAAIALEAGNKVTIYERENCVFAEASGNNQNRLHLGFHYPRAFETRIQSKFGFDWFLDRYATLTRSIKNNFYGISENDSLLDFATYEQIMKSSGLNFSRVNNDFGFRGLSQIIQVDERLILTNKAKKYFTNLLKSQINFNQNVDLSDGGVEQLKKSFDLIVDCTWRTADPNDNNKFYYEPCIYFKYKKKEIIDIALTIMDGPFFSLYPCSERLHSLTSVEYGPLGQFSSYEMARDTIENFSNDFESINQKKLLFEELTNKYYPHFNNIFNNPRASFGIKTKHFSSNDERTTKIDCSDKLLRIFSGKIDTMYIAEKELRKVWS